MSTEMPPEVIEIEDDEVQQTQNAEEGEIVFEAEQEMSKEVEEGDFIIIDSVGCTDENTSVECLNSTQDSQEEPEVVFTKDESGLFCLDTTPQIEKEKALGPRFRRV